MQASDDPISAETGKLALQEFASLPDELEHVVQSLKPSAVAGKRVAGD